MTDKMKAIFVMVLTSIVMAVLILAGCSSVPARLQLDRCEYQIFPAPAELPIPVFDGDFEDEAKETKGHILCQR